MSDSHLDPHLQSEDSHSDHHAPTRTTPQGTQAQGVEFGHEGRDLSFRPIFYWFGGFLIFLGLSLLMLHTTMGLWTAKEARETALPSPLFAQQQEIPAPRILPNPIDSGLNPMEVGQRYPEALPADHEQEMEDAVRVGVVDATTREPALPTGAVSKVLSQNGAAGGGAPAPAGAGEQGATSAVRELMPSDSSGGRAMEDRLR
jgi:hypothetical protein